MENTTVDPTHLLGMMGMDIETVVKILLESRGIGTSAAPPREPTDEEIEELWETANSEVESV
jgi:hypothetical protein